MENSLKGAVLIIGSLLWENETNAIKKEQGRLRTAWRNQNLDMKRAEKIQLPIRYGRKSESRYCTYTMLFSNSCPKAGSGYIIPFKPEILIKPEDLLTVRNLAVGMAKAEGICKKDESVVFKNWGVVALCATEKLKKEEPATHANLLKFWNTVYADFSNGDNFAIDRSEKPSVTNDGLMNFDFELPEGLNDIDFIFGTPVVPNITAYPSAEKIAGAMLESKPQYLTYFRENLERAITTFQDAAIDKCLAT